MCTFVFFFQAEDGIRDLVRSRGLGDVYKRQALDHLQYHFAAGNAGELVVGTMHDQQWEFDCLQPVSYTHLTLPTSDLV